MKKIILTLKKSYKYLIMLLVGIAFVFNSCKDDDPVEPDPCSVYPEKMEILIEWDNAQWSTLRDIEFVETLDSIFTIPSNLIFKTNYAYDSISWKIGAEANRRIGTKIVVRFEDDALNSSIFITAECFRSIDTKCFGRDDDGIDTLQRRITFKSRYESPLIGTWRGVNDGETDSFDVEIHNLFWINSEGEKVFDLNRFTGLPKGTKSIEDYRNIILRWHEFTGNRDEYDRNGLNMRTLYGRIQVDGSIRIDWDTREKTSGTFIGNKIK
jgi:hypothetical protein